MVEALNDAYSTAFIRNIRIGTTVKKPFPNKIMSRESFLFSKTARRLLLGAKNENGMILLSKNLKLKYPRNKLISCKCLVLRKM